VKRYRANTLITLPSGSVVALNPKQAADRKGRIEPLQEKGNYRLKEALQFKRGEAFGYEGDLPKTVVSEMVAAERADTEREAPGKPAAR